MVKHAELEVAATPPHAWDNCEFKVYPLKGAAVSFTWLSHSRVKLRKQDFLNVPFLSSQRKESNTYLLINKKEILLTKHVKRAQLS